MFCKVQNLIDDNQLVLQELVHHIGTQITPKTSNHSSASTMSDITTFNMQHQQSPAQQAYAAASITLPPEMLHYRQKLDAKLTTLEQRVQNTSSYPPSQWPRRTHGRTRSPHHHQALEERNKSHRR